jgi:hypothetical protein
MKPKFNAQTTKARNVTANTTRSDPKLAALRMVQGDLIELLREGANEEYGIPPLSEAAFRYTWDIIAETGRIMEGDFPYGGVASDGQGGVRIEWQRDDQGVHLAVPSDPGQSYIYVEEGDNHRLDEEGSAGTLSTHLANFVRL